MSQNKRLNILKKSIELFSKQGFESVSIQDITNYCGISKGAFYLSFKSKEELMISIIEHLLTQVALIFDRSVNENLTPQLSLYKLIEELLSNMRSNRGIATYFMHEHTLFQIKNTNIIRILHQYEKQSSMMLGIVLERVYGNKIEPYKQDLILSLNSLFHTYFEYVCIRGLDIDVSILAQSLVEKMNILAHAKYDHALPNDKLLELSLSNRLSEDDLEQFKIRLIQDLELRLLDETHQLKIQALLNVKEQLASIKTNPAMLYAFWSLLSSYAEYEDLALRLGAYIKIVYPQ